jgi:hypothetical protein
MVWKMTVACFYRAFHFAPARFGFGGESSARTNRTGKKRETL